jgi:peroxiredoxin Q/BCP
MQLGDQLPNITLPATGQQQINLADLQGKAVVLYFYPKDHTAACTQEGEDFRDHHAEFVAADAIILGVSRDGVRKHERFKADYHFPFDLLADTKGDLCNLFNVLYPKTMFGKPAIGLERSTYLFDRTGKLVQEWRKVKVPEHVLSVLEAVRALPKD